MSRGLTDLPEPEEQDDSESSEEVQQIIRELILGQNKLHDRIIDLERKLDHMVAAANTAEEPQTKWWHKGL